MPIVKCNNFIDVYRHKAGSKDINELSGRTGRPDLTRFVSQQIVREVHLKETDILVDIGCGDGTLLKLASGTMGSGIGILPTQEEIERVRADIGTSIPKIRIQQGLVQRTNLDSAVADKVVCNGVIVCLAEHEVNSALREIVRISKPGALVFIGEVPNVNEFESKTYGDSIMRWLWWVLTEEGMSAFGRHLLRTLKVLVSREPFVITPKTHFYESQDKFAERAEACGLSLQTSFPHREKTNDHVEESKTRLDYVFCAVE